MSASARLKSLGVKVEISNEDGHEFMHVFMPLNSWFSAIKNIVNNG